MEGNGHYEVPLEGWQGQVSGEEGIPIEMVGMSIPLGWQWGYQNEVIRCFNPQTGMMEPVPGMHFTASAEVPNDFPSGVSTDASNEIQQTEQTDEESIDDVATVRAPSPVLSRISAIPLAGRRLTSPRYFQTCPRERPQIVETPISELTEEEQQNYQTFKTVYNSLFDLEQVPVDMWNTYKRVYQDYARYAGIPEYVRYTLDHEFPYYGTLEDVTAYYQSAEWDRTNGWDPNERVSLLDRNALEIAQSRSQHSSPVASTNKRQSSPSRRSSTPTPDSTGPIDTVYVVLMHYIPDCAERLKNRDGNEPVACTETFGDVLYVIIGEETCKRESYVPPDVTHTLRGEMALCGFKKNGKPMIVRGRQDVGRIYTVMHEEHLRQQRESSNE